MATIKELKEWLNQFPEDTEVFFSEQQPALTYESYGCIEFKPADLTEVAENYGYGNNWEFSDFRNNQFVKEDSTHFGKTYLYIGSKY